MKSQQSTFGCQVSKSITCRRSFDGRAVGLGDVIAHFGAAHHNEPFTLRYESPTSRGKCVENVFAKTLVFTDNLPQHFPHGSFLFFCGIQTAQVFSSKMDARGRQMGKMDRENVKTAEIFHNLALSHFPLFARQLAQVTDLGSWSNLEPLKSGGSNRIQKILENRPKICRPRGLNTFGSNAYTDGLSVLPEMPSKRLYYENSSQCQAIVRPLQNCAPPRRGVRRLQQPAPQAAAGMIVGAGVSACLVPKGPVGSDARFLVQAQSHTVIRTPIDQ